MNIAWAPSSRRAADRCPLLAASAALLVGIAGVELSDHFLIMIAAIFAGLTVAFYVLREFIWPLARRHLLRTHPIDLYFVVTSADRYTLGYVHQDHQQHKTTELVVPAHADDLYIQLIMRARRAFTQSQLVFGFDGDADKYPLLKHWYVGFIKIGLRQRHPGEADAINHYIDHHDRYHIVEERHRPKGQWITFGFKVTTREPGTYKGRLELSIEDIEYSTESLTLYVEDDSSRRVRCVEPGHWDCFISPIISGKNR